MNPPKVYEVTNPKIQSTTSMIEINTNIFSFLQILRRASAKPELLFTISVLI